MGLLQGLGRFSNTASGLLFPGMDATGVDPRIAQAARAQAMMQMGAGLLGGQNFGQAYGFGQQAGYEPIEQARRQATLDMARADREAEARYREEMIRRQDEDALEQRRMNDASIRDRNRDNIRQRGAVDEQLRHNRAMEGNAAADNARMAEDAALRRRALDAQLTQEAQQRDLQQRLLYGDYAPKGRGGGPAQKRTGGALDKFRDDPMTQYALATGNSGFLPRAKSADQVLADAMAQAGGGQSVDAAAALSDARAAVATGRISREQAAARLRAAGIDPTGL